MIKTLLLEHGVRYGHLSPIASPEWKRVQALFTGNCFQSLSFMLRWAWLYLVHISQPHTPALTPSPPGVPRTTSQIQEPGIGRTWNSASGHSPIHSGNPVPGRLHWTVFFFFKLCLDFSVRFWIQRWMSYYYSHMLVCKAKLYEAQGGTSHCWTPWRLLTVIYWCFLKTAVWLSLGVVSFRESSWLVWRDLCFYTRGKKNMTLTQ